MRGRGGGVGAELQGPAGVKCAYGCADAVGGVAGMPGECGRGRGGRCSGVGVWVGVVIGGRGRHVGDAAARGVGEEWIVCADAGGVCGCRAEIAAGVRWRERVWGGGRGRWDRGGVKQRTFMGVCCNGSVCAVEGGTNGSGSGGGGGGLGGGL